MHRMVIPDGLPSTEPLPRIAHVVNLVHRDAMLGRKLLGHGRRDLDMANVRIAIHKVMMLSKFF